ncbi:ABC transporter permease [Bacteroidota bacterium]
MKKILILAKREYIASVRTKGFLIALIVLPIFMGGGFLAYALLKDKVDTKDKKVVLIDESGVVAKKVQEAADYRNKNEIFDEKTKEKNKPAYLIEIVQAENDLDKQKLELSNRVRERELHGFVHISPDVVHPVGEGKQSRIFYYSENSSMDSFLGWVSRLINNHLKQLRVEELKLDQNILQDLFYYNSVEGMGLISMDEKTGDINEAKSSNELESVLLPYFMMLLMFMMLMMAAIPLLSAVMEEKGERIAEVLLGSVTPFQFMMGKIMGGVGVSLTTSSIYIIGIVFTAGQLNFLDKIPLEVIPWFFVYMVLAIIMVGSIMAALGSACNDAKDAQSMQFPAMVPLFIPMMLILVIIQNPMGSLATGLSLFPPFTPMLMVARMASPVAIPLWQPIVGMIGVLIFAIFSVWAGGRIFRSAILLQGKRPKLGLLLKFIIKG